MRASRVICGMAATAMTAFGSLTAAPAAHASNYGVELNGTYRVKSDGEWARKNDVKFKQQSVLETWTVTTECETAIKCTGEVRSDLGWTGSLRYDGYFYRVEHEVPDWLPCPDGTFAVGRQLFMLWGVDPATEEHVTHNLKYFAGRNVTKGPSGACGVNKPMVIELPVRMEKIG